MAAPATPDPPGNPVLAAAAEAIIRRHLACAYGTGTEEARRAAIALTALEDAAAALAVARKAGWLLAIGDWFPDHAGEADPE